LGNKSVSWRFSKRLVRHAAHGRHLSEGQVEVVEDGREEGVGGLVHRPLHLGNAVIPELALSVIKNIRAGFLEEQILTLCFDYTGAFTPCQKQKIRAHNFFFFLVAQCVILWGYFSFFEPATNSICAWKLL
jgi:hypothetical protein